MIPFNCQTCGGRLEVPDEYLGRSCRCPSCGTVGRVSTGRAEDVGGLAGGAVAGADDVAAALSASWRAAPRESPPETGTGGSVQYDLSGLFDAHAGPAEGPPGPQGDPADSGGPWQAVPLFAAPSAGAAPPVAVPEYFGLRVMGILYVVVGAGCLLGAVAICVTAVVEAVLGKPLLGPLGGWPGLAAAIGLFLAGIVQVGLGLLASCVRDLARAGPRR